MSYPEKPKRYEKRKRESVDEGLTGSFFTSMAVRTVLIIGLVILSLTIFYAIYRFGPVPENAKPEAGYQSTVAPTAVYTMPVTPWYETHMWLRIDEVPSLRAQANVVNLAFVKKSGSVLYSATSSVVFTKVAPWEKTRLPFGLTAATVTGTAVAVEVNGNVVVLNIYQPFVLESDPETIYLVISDGSLWSAPKNGVSLRFLKEVVPSLPQNLAPNLNLSLTF